MRDRYGDVVRFVPEPSSQAEPSLPPPPIPENHQQPSFPHHTPEERILWNAIGIDPDGGWNSEGIPAFTTNYRNLEQFTGEFPDNGQPPEVNRRRNWSTQLIRCDTCGGVAAYWIDRCELRQGYYCDGCHADYNGTSYLEIETNRKPRDAIISDHRGYIADDPLLSEESLWGHGIFHLGAPMGSGKTTLIYQRAREALESNAITILFVPRISLAQAAHAELAQQQIDSQWLPLSNIGLTQEAHAELARRETTLWSLFHEGSEKAKPKRERWKIGEIGSVATLGMMPRLLAEISQNHSDRPVLFFFDEIDFITSLRLSEIFKAQSDEIKQIFKDAAHHSGIVTAGQTASTLALEAIAKDLDAPLKGYYTTPKILEQTATLHTVDSHSIDQPKNRLTQAVIDHINKIINNTNKNIYIHADERRFCQIVKSLHPDLTVIYDAYHRESPESKDLLWRKRLPDDKRIFVSSNAVDVGISIEDSYAETIVVSLSNTLHIGGLDSVVQRCMRNRQKPSLSIYHLKHQNALPIAPSQASKYYKANISRLMNDDETAQDGFVDVLGIEFGMRSLADSQPETFIQHHLEIAGFSVNALPIDLERVDFEQVKSIRKSIQFAESEKVQDLATELLTPETLLMESEIRQRTWEESQPAPIDRLAHERANATMRMCGWTGHVEREDPNTIEADPFETKGVTSEMWRTARQAVSFNSDKVKKWKIGFFGVHHTEALHEDDSESTLHHRRDDRPLALLIKSLLERLPREPASKEKVGQALIDAAQVRYGDRRLSEILKDGSISPGIAKQVRFISLGKDATSIDAHFQFVKKIISEYYPARIAKVGTLYQLAGPKNTDAVEIFKQVVKCYINHRHPDIDPDDPDNSDLTPPPTPSAFQVETETAREMKAEGLSQREIALKIGMSRSWVAKVISDAGGHGNSNIGALVEKTVATPEHPESAPSHVPTAFEADSDSKSQSINTFDQTTAKSNITIKAQILDLLACGGEKTTKELLGQVEGQPASIKAELKRLVDAGEIQKPRRGRYILANVKDEVARTETDGTKKQETFPAVASNQKHRVIIETQALPAFRQIFPNIPVIGTKTQTIEGETLSDWDELPGVAFIDRDEVLSGARELDWMPIVYDSSRGDMARNGVGRRFFFTCHSSDSASISSISSRC